MIILLVEDDYNHFLLSKTLLEIAGIEYFWAENGDKAVEICRKYRAIDMVFMDIRLPGIDGYETTKRIKSFRKDLPVIALTACAMSDDKQISLNKNCNDYMSKPYTGNDFFSMIEKWTGVKTAKIHEYY